MNGRAGIVYGAAFGLLSAVPVLGQASSTTLTGRILPSESGVPWAGAAVRVAGSDALVCADASGRFSLPVASGSLVIVEPVGFPATEMVVTPADDEALLPMASHLIHLEGVVVRAYASTPSNMGRRLTGIDGEELARSPGTLSAALTAKVPGASVQQNSAAPGTASQVRIRGLSTLLGATDPLVVVDGVPVTSATVAGGSRFVTGAEANEVPVGGRLDELNPHDIARVEVISGAAATQRFGPRAANGVLSITTHRGQAAETGGVDPAFRCYRPPR